MYMPFGKYKGWHLSDVPVDYLEWLVTWNGLRDSMRYEVQQELRRRFGTRSYGTRAPPEPKEARIGVDVADVWRRKMAFEFHPDRGGTVEGMRAINRGYEYLRELLLGS